MTNKKAAETLSGSPYGGLIVFAVGSIGPHFGGRDGLGGRYPAPGDESERYGIGIAARRFDELLRGFDFKGAS